MNKKAIIFGLGDSFRKHYERLRREYTIVAVSDNYSKHPPRCEKFIAPSEIVHCDYDKIIVTPYLHREEIISQLLDLGVSQNEITFLERESEINISPFAIDPEYFSLALSEENKRALFRRNVEAVCIELNSQCNRKCWFCPNSFIDRHSTNTDMSDELIDKIIKELQEIDYASDVFFSFFNEPLLAGNLENRISKFKLGLPNSRIHIVTNGDHLDAQKLENLYVAGLDRLLISCYIAPNKETVWEYNNAKEFIQNKVKLLGIDVYELSQCNDINCTFIGKYKNMSVMLSCNNFNAYGYHRGKLMSDIINTKKLRKDICVAPYTVMAIANTGEVVLCCQIHHQAKQHKDYIVGNLNQSTIFDIWYSPQFTKLRTEILCNVNAGVCEGCLADATNVLLNLLNEPFLGRPKDMFTAKERQKYSSQRFGFY